MLFKKTPADAQPVPPLPHAMRRMSRAAGALKPPWGRRGSIRSKILAGFTVILVGMLSINLLVIGLSHHFLGEYHILAERVISANKLIPTVRDDVSLDAYYLVAGRRTLETTQLSTTWRKSARGCIAEAGEQF